MLAGFLAALSLTGCVTTGDVSDERFVRFFDELSFGVGLGGERRDTLTRWDGAFSVSVRGTPEFAASAERIAGAVARMAALPDPGAAGPDRPPAVTISQEPDGTLFPVERDRVDCYIRYTRRQSRIVGAEIHVAASEPARVEHCLYHELLHALGLGHSGAIASVMSPFHDAGTPTRWDMMAARMVMSTRLAPGMTRDRVLAAVRAELPTLRAWPEAFTAREAALSRGRAAS